MCGPRYEDIDRQRTALLEEDEDPILNAARKAEIGLLNREQVLLIQEHNGGTW